ncbi:MAG: insulinase family protein [Halanaerobiales bacterium]|nr:insulinase family protein [Halanaerobiales bacterium]
MNQIYDPVIKETIYSKKLTNGLPIFVLPKKGFHQKYAVFGTHYGSLDNKFLVPGESNLTEVPDGIAHFLEHKMFEEREINIFDKFAALGANVNAYTTYTSTSYLFDTIENFPECLELLLDFVQNIYLTEESVEKEKGIIAQEILMYTDDPDWIGYQKLMETLFHKYPVRIDIAGTVESIYQINRELLYKCYQTFYHPSNMVLFIMGDVHPEWIFELVQKNQDRKDFILQPPIKRYYADEPKGVNEKRIESRMSVSRPIYNLGFKEQDLGYEGDAILKKELVTSILLELLVGKGSKLYQSLYSSGLIDDSFSISFTAEKDHGMTVIGGHTNNPERLHRVLVDGIQFRIGKIEVEEMERIKKRMIGDYITTFDSLKGVGQNFMSYYFKNINLFNELKILEEINSEDLEKRLVKHFDLDYHAVSIIYPANPTS